MSKPSPEAKEGQAQGEEKPPTIEEVLAELAKRQSEDREAINAMAKAIVELNAKLEGKGGSAGGENKEAASVLKAIFGKEGGSSLDDLPKIAKSFADTADALSQFRNPVLPYSPADRFLMRAGARAVHRIVYEGVKGRTVDETEVTDEELDRELGFAKEKKGKKGETEHVSE